MPMYGLDFGTTTTYLTDPKNGTVLAIPLGIGITGAPYDADALLSRVRKTESGELLVGDRSGVRSLKRMLVDGPEQGLSEAEVDQYILAIFKQVRETALKSKIDLSQPNSLRLGCPAAWGYEARARLLSLARRAGLGLDYKGLVEEPVAAGLAWIDANVAEAVKPGLTFVFDMGGGTLDVSVLDVQANSSDPASPDIWVLSSLGNNFAGDKVDIGLLAKVLGKISPTDYEVNIALESVEEAKINLSSSSENSLKARISSSNNLTVDVTRKDLKEMISESFEAARKTMEDALRQAYLWDLVRHSGAGRGAHEPGMDGTFYAPQFMGRLIEESKRVDFAELAASVTNVVLAGGMTNVLEIRDELKRIFRNATFYPEGVNIGFASEKRVSMGLATQKAFKSLNFSKPPFDVVVGSRVHYRAFDNALKSEFIRDSSPVLRRRACMRSEGRIGIRFFGNDEIEAVLDKAGSKIELRHSVGCETAPIAECRDCNESHRICDCRLVSYPDGTLVAFDSSKGESVATLRSYFGANFHSRSASRTASSIHGGNGLQLVEHWRLPKDFRSATKSGAAIMYPTCSGDHQPEDVRTHLEFRKDLAKIWGAVRYLSVYVQILEELEGNLPKNGKHSEKVNSTVEAWIHGTPGHRSCQQKWSAFWIANMCVLGWPIYDPKVVKPIADLVRTSEFQEWSKTWFDSELFQDNNQYR